MRREEPPHGYGQSYAHSGRHTECGAPPSCAVRRRFAVHGCLALDRDGRELSGDPCAESLRREEYLFVTPVDTPFADSQMARELMAYMADDSKKHDAALVIDGDGRLQTLLGIYHKRVLPALTQRLADGRREKLQIRDFLRDLDVVYVNAQALTDGVRKSTSCNTPQEWQQLMEQESFRRGDMDRMAALRRNKRTL